MLASTSFLTVGVVHGLGSHTDLLPHDDAVESLKWFWISQNPAIYGIYCGRLSITVLLFKILGPKHRWQRATLWFSAISNLVLNIMAGTLILI